VTAGEGLQYPQARLGRAAATLLLLVLVAGLYWPGVGGGFAFDDYSNLVFNLRIHVTTLDPGAWLAAAMSSPAADLPRPLAMLSFAANHFFTGLDPRPMKATNIAIHLLNAVLAMGVARQLFRVASPGTPERIQAMVSFAAGAWWALLPINVTAVLLVVQRMESLSHTFVFAGLWLYVSGRAREVHGQRSWAFPATLGATVVGTLVKESGVLLPLYCLVLELLVFRFARNHRTDRRLLGCYVALVAAGACVAVLWLLPRALSPHAFDHRSFTLYERLVTEPRIVVDYLRWTIAPNPRELGLFHDDYTVSTGLWHPPSTMLAMLFLAAMAALAIAVRTARPMLSLAIAWFFIAHLLTATFIPLELAFEHRNYFSSFAVCLALANLLARLAQGSPTRWLPPVLALLVGVFHGGITLIRTTEWSSPLRFATLEAAKHPASPRTTYSLAQAYSILSQNKTSSPYYAMAITAFRHARSVPNAGLLPAQGQAILQSKAGDTLEPGLWDEILTALRRRPVGPQETSALGSMTSCSVNATCHFPVDRMMEVFSVAMARGENPEVLNIFGNYTLNILHAPALAEAAWVRAHELSPRDPQYVVNLAKLTAAMGKTADSRAWVARLRGMGRFHQFEREADALERELRLPPPAI
jgi:hypothetical protein